jgi:1-acyl-sn-glycerol-3-phosphate acyltransferase
VAVTDTGPEGSPVGGQPPRWELALYGAIRVIVVAFCRWWWRLEVHGAEHLPANGAFVLAPVHRSNADTFVVSALTRRRLRYMGKHTLWKHPLPGRFLTAMGGFPVRRGAADREALRRCAQVLEGGEPLVVFPEGTRQSGPKVGELQEGAAYLAARAGVPIIPVGIGGSEHAMVKGSKRLRRVKVVVMAGEPLPAPPSEGRVPRSAVSRLSAELHSRLQALQDQALPAAEGGATRGLPRR